MTAVIKCISSIISKCSALIGTVLWEIFFIKSLRVQTTFKNMDFFVPLVPSLNPLRIKLPSVVVLLWFAADIKKKSVVKFRRGRFERKGCKYFAGENVKLKRWRRDVMWCVFPPLTVSYGFFLRWDISPSSPAGTGAGSPHWSHPNKWQSPTAGHNASSCPIH